MQVQRDANRERLAELYSEMKPLQESMDFAHSSSISTPSKKVGASFERQIAALSADIQECQDEIAALLNDTELLEASYASLHDAISSTPTVDVPQIYVPTSPPSKPLHEIAQMQQAIDAQDMKLYKIEQVLAQLQDSTAAIASAVDALATSMNRQATATNAEMVSLRNRFSQFELRTQAEAKARLELRSSGPSLTESPLQHNLQISPNVNEESSSSRRSTTPRPSVKHVKPERPLNSPFWQPPAAVVPDVAIGEEVIDEFAHLEGELFVTQAQQNDNFDNREPGYGLPAKSDRSRIAPMELKWTASNSSNSVENSEKSLAFLREFERGIATRNAFYPLLLEKQVIAMLFSFFHEDALVWLEAQQRADQRFRCDYRRFVEKFASDYISKAYLLSQLKRLRVSESTVLRVERKGDPKSLMVFIESFERLISEIQALLKFFPDEPVSLPNDAELVRVIHMNSTLAHQTNVRFLYEQGQPKIPWEKISAARYLELLRLSVQTDINNAQEQSKVPSPSQSTGSTSTPPRRLAAVDLFAPPNPEADALFVSMIANVQEVEGYENYGQDPSEGEALHDICVISAAEGTNYVLPMVDDGGFICAFTNSHNEQRPTICYRCGEPGHMARDCPLPIGDGSLPHRPVRPAPSASLPNGTKGGSKFIDKGKGKQRRS